ncbi:MAG: FAD-dependent oxidoreductase [Burkholderiales bacterium]|nr:FAD-dependent oxidoreductase [Burkholderiales bacterium]
MKKTLALVGGGHAHIEVLRQLSVNPAPDLDIALFDPSPTAWYSGMLPGVIAGHYDSAAAKLNLWALCQRARVRFFETPIVSINGEGSRIESGFGERHRYDVLSIDIGSVARPIPASSGAYVVAVKPIEPLLTAIAEFDSVRTSSLIVRVIGGGAAAVETALALAWRWRESSRRRVSLVCANTLLNRHPARARRLALAACRRLNVEVIEKAQVRGIEPTRLRMDSGETLDTQLTVLATGYAPAPLLAKAQIGLAPDGSVSVNEALQCTANPEVFAAGDCATIKGLAVPKSGVFAVRQGPVLAANLIAACQGRPLQRYEHNPQSLNLISLGVQRAIAVRNGLSLEGAWVWRWKDSIDRSWMQKYAVS